MLYVVYLFAAGWTLTIVAIWFGALVQSVADALRGYEGWFVPALLFFVVGPLVLLLAGLPWAIIEDASRPVLDTLHKGDWSCASSRNSTTVVPISSGKTTTIDPITSSVCEQYVRIR